MRTEDKGPGSASGLLRAIPGIRWAGAAEWQSVKAGETVSTDESLIILRERSWIVTLVHAPEGALLTGPLSWSAVPCANARAEYDRMLRRHGLRAPRTRSTNLTRAFVGILRHTPLAPLSRLVRPFIGKPLYDELFRPEEARKPGLIALQSGTVRPGKPLSGWGE